MHETLLFARKMDGGWFLGRLPYTYVYMYTQTAIHTHIHVYTNENAHIHICGTPLSYLPFLGEVQEEWRVQG